MELYYTRLPLNQVTNSICMLTKIGEYCPDFGLIRRCFMYAVIATGGKQYKVSEGDVIRVEKLGVEAGGTYSFDKVLLVSGDEMKIGNPTVDGATVEADVIGDVKGKKVIVYKFKRKTGYHKKNGHRQQYTAVKITKINA